MNHWVARVWDRLMLYLPVFIMGVLALATYWLVRSGPVAAPISVDRQRGHEPDYFMEGFNLRSYDLLGRLRSEIRGSLAQHYPDTRSIEIDAIRIRSYDKAGRLTTATASKGLTNEDATEVQLIGNAVVVREAVLEGTGIVQPRIEYRGEFLHAFMDSEKIQSHKPVQLRRGNDIFTAERLDYDNVARVVQLNGRVRGTLVPTPTTPQ